MATREGVGEMGGVGGDIIRERGFEERGFVEEEEGAGGVGGVPKREEGKTTWEGRGRGGDGEKEVMESSGNGGRGGGESLAQEEIGRGERTRTEEEEGLPV